MLDLAQHNTDRLINLVNDILDMEQLDSGELEFNFQALDLSSLVADVVESNNGYAEEHGVTFVILEGDPEIMVEGDASRLSRLIANLLFTAAKFSPEGGEVEVSVSQENTVGRVSVSDHGPGIPDNFSDQIFGIFTQEDSSAAPQKGGTGLGLNISRSIIERHGGTINFLPQLMLAAPSSSPYLYQTPISQMNSLINAMR